MRFTISNFLYTKPLLVRFAVVVGVILGGIIMGESSLSACTDGAELRYPPD